MSNKIEYNGVTYNSLRNLCELNNVSYNTIYSRIKAGHTIEEAISKPIKSKWGSIEFEGHRFKSIRELCRHYKLHPATFCGRRDLGWTLKECVYGKIDEFGKSRLIGKIEFNGKIYKSFKELCEAYDVNYANCRMRYHRGWTIEECILGKGVKNE